MMTVVELQLVGGLGLQYAPGAEAGLLDAALDPIFNDAWQAFVATFPGMTLVPLFDDLLRSVADRMAEAVRLREQARLELAGLIESLQARLPSPERAARRYFQSRCHQR